MQTVHALCKPRESVFSDSSKDETRNLNDLIEGKIDPANFFAENFQTQGMKVLLDTAFKRFAGKSDRGVIKLTQAMGGGKTHNMLALALLAMHPEWREPILGKGYDDVGEIKVVVFFSRISDATHTIYRSIAKFGYMLLVQVCP